MRVSKLLTTRLPAGEGTDDLLAMAGYTHRLADGLYTLLPLGQRVLQRISSIVRREMARTGAQEVIMPLLQPEGIWQQFLTAGETRAGAFGRQLFCLRGEPGERLVLAPTHEEVAAIIAAACIREARDLPRILYQIQPRFRNQDCGVKEGLLRTREFIMADAYSFHADRAGLEEEYASMKDAFCRITALCGLTVEVVAADMGSVGGDESHELVATLHGQEAIAVHCHACGYRANIDVAEFTAAEEKEETPGPLDEVAGPDGLSPDGLAAWCGISSAKHLTWTPFVAGGKIVLAVLPADLILNPVKLFNTLCGAGLNISGFHKSSAQELVSLGASYESVSLVRTPESVLVIADRSVQTRSNFLLPSTRRAHFMINLNSGRDFRVDMFADLSVATDGARCPQCRNPMRTIHGIEVGHIFKLGSRYTEAFGARVEGPEAAAQPLHMGCYGLGMTRLMATIAEQKRDGRGIVWPENVSPFCAVIVARQGGVQSNDAAGQLYRRASSDGLDVLLDDSGDPLEEKLRNADLRGMPLAILPAENRNEMDRFEIRERGSGLTHHVHAEGVVALLQDRRHRLP